MEDVNLHSFAPFLGAQRDRVWYKERLPGGPAGLLGGQPCPPFLFWKGFINIVDDAALRKTKSGQSTGNDLVRDTLPIA